MTKFCLKAIPESIANSALKDITVSQIASHAIVTHPTLPTVCVTQRRVNAFVPTVSVAVNAMNAILVSMTIPDVNTVPVIQSEQMRAFATLRPAFASAKPATAGSGAIDAQIITSVIPIALNVCAMRSALTDRYVTAMESVFAVRTSVDSSAETVRPDSINIQNVFPVPVITGALMGSLVIIMDDVFAKINLKVIYIHSICFID